MSLLDEMNRVREERGELTDEAIVAAATPKAHPLHNRFEWDNRIAGHKYRLVQAQELIRTVRTAEVTPTDELRQVRAFVSVPRPEGRRYEPTREVANDPIASTLVLQEMRREWAAFKRRYQHLEEFLNLIRDDVAA